ncbi:MAG: C_GCAxxG_C_C family protein [Desulfarculus sp.]|nr:MAG: C_GCAxxG_C_C family protein [Desulfarculus sp.]
MDEETIRLLELGRQGFHCSQILLLLGLEAQGKSDPDLIRAMEGLAGGLGFTGEVCGALSGGACLLGLFAGRGRAEEARDPRLDMMVSELVEWFNAEFGPRYGGIRCEQILEGDLQARSQRCPGLVLGVLARVKELLAEYGLAWGGSRP